MLRISRLWPNQFISEFVDDPFSRSMWRAYQKRVKWIGSGSYNDVFVMTYGASEVILRIGYIDQLHTGRIDRHAGDVPPVRWMLPTDVTRHIDEVAKAMIFNNVCPHFVMPFAHQYVVDNQRFVDVLRHYVPARLLDARSRTLYPGRMVLTMYEKLDDTLFRVLKNLSATGLKTVVFQVVFALACLQNNPSTQDFTHYDLSVSNILFKKHDWYNQFGYIHYTFRLRQAKEGFNFTVPVGQGFAVLSDYDSAVWKDMQNAQWPGFHPGPNAMEIYQRYGYENRPKLWYDMYFFLRQLYNFARRFNQHGPLMNKIEELFGNGDDRLPETCRFEWPSRNGQYHNPVREVKDRLVPYNLLKDWSAFTEFRVSNTPYVYKFGYPRPDPGIQLTPMTNYGITELRRLYADAEDMSLPMLMEVKRKLTGFSGPMMHSRIKLVKHIRSLIDSYDGVFDPSARLPQDYARCKQRPYRNVYKDVVRSGIRPVGSRKALCEPPQHDQMLDVNAILGPGNGNDSNLNSLLHAALNRGDAARNNNRLRPQNGLAPAHDDLAQVDQELNDLLGGLLTP